MKKLIITLLLIVLSGVVGVHISARSPKSKKIQLRTESDSLSYAFGVDVGQYAKGIDSMIEDSGINIDIFLESIREAAAGRETMSVNDAHTLLNEYFSVRLPERARVREEEFLCRFRAENPDYTETESGLFYKIIDAGDPEIKALSSDYSIEVDYTGRDKDGHTFDSSFDRGESNTFFLYGIIPGWSEGIKLIGKGGHIKMLIPSNLAYGNRGAGGNIGPYEPLLFDVWLLNVLPPEEEVYDDYEEEYEEYETED